MNKPIKFKVKNIDIHDINIIIQFEVLYGFLNWVNKGAIYELKTKEGYEYWAFSDLIAGLFKSKKQI